MISLSTKVNSVETPNVTINGYIGQPGIDGNGPGQLKFDSLIFQFDRLLGKPKNEILNHQKVINRIPSFRIKTVKLNNQYNSIVFKRELSRMSRGIYILNNSDISIGYCFLEQQYIGNLENEPEIIKIKSLSVNSNYLKNDINLPNGTTLKFYEKDHGDYIERYCILDQEDTENGHTEHIMMDSFYPKILDSKLKKRIVTVLNYNINPKAEDNNDDSDIIIYNDSDD